MTANNHTGDNPQESSDIEPHTILRDTEATAEVALDGAGVYLLAEDLEADTLHVERSRGELTLSAETPQGWVSLVVPSARRDELLEAIAATAEGEV